MGKVLGKGLKAIIKTNNTEENDRYLLGQININKISPNENQPRNLFDSNKMDELIQSIKEHGILQPITIREKADGNYEIIAGERRYRAAVHLNLQWLPAYTLTINNESELMEYALIENIQRVDLNPIEEAEGYAILRGKYDLNQTDIAKKVAKSRSEIANKMRLLKLPPIIKEGLRQKKISYGHARSLIIIKKSVTMISIYHKIVKNNLSVRESEKLIKSYKVNNQQVSNEIKNQKHNNLINGLDTYLKVKVEAKLNKQNGGLLNIHFSSLRQLKQIIKKIKNEQ